MNDNGDGMMELKLDACDLPVGSPRGSPLAKPWNIVPWSFGLFHHVSWFLGFSHMISLGLFYFDDFNYV